MQQNSILNFINSIDIKHKDIPHILILLAIIFGACLLGWVLLGLVGLITAAILAISSIGISLQYNFYRAMQRRNVYQQQKLQDYITLFDAINFRASVPYMTGYAASPELARVVYENVIELKPQYILELGGGVSSIIAGYALEQNGSGSLLSIDHNKKYLKLTEKRLRLHDLNKWVKGKHAALKQQEVNGRDRIWYDISNVSFEEPIDMVLIDGPPEQTQYKARYAALPLLYPHLNDNVIIILDDAKRPSTQQVIKDWQNEFTDLSYRYIDTERGIAIFNR